MNFRIRKKSADSRVPRAVSRDSDSRPPVSNSIERSKLVSPDPFKELSQKEEEAQKNQKERSKTPTMPLSFDERARLDPMLLGQELNNSYLASQILEMKRKSSKYSNIQNYYKTKMKEEQPPLLEDPAEPFMANPTDPQFPLHLLKGGNTLKNKVKNDIAGFFKKNPSMIMITPAQRLIEIHTENHPRAKNKKIYHSTATKIDEFIKVEIHSRITKLTNMSEILRKVKVLKLWKRVVSTTHFTRVRTSLLAQVPYATKELKPIFRFVKETLLSFSSKHIVQVKPGVIYKYQSQGTEAAPEPESEALYTSISELLVTSQRSYEEFLVLFKNEMKGKLQEIERQIRARREEITAYRERIYLEKLQKESEKIFEHYSTQLANEKEFKELLKVNGLIDNTFAKFQRSLGYMFQQAIEEQAKHNFEFIAHSFGGKNQTAFEVNAIITKEGKVQFIPSKEELHACAGKLVAFLAAQIYNSLKLDELIKMSQHTPPKIVDQILKHLIMQFKEERLDQNALSRITKRINQDYDSKVPQVALELEFIREIEAFFRDLTLEVQPKLTSIPIWQERMNENIEKMRDLVMSYFSMAEKCEAYFSKGDHQIAGVIAVSLEQFVSRLKFLVQETAGIIKSIWDTFTNYIRHVRRQFDESLESFSKVSMLTTKFKSKFMTDFEEPGNKKEVDAAKTGRKKYEMFVEFVELIKNYTIKQEEYALFLQQVHKILVLMKRKKANSPTLGFGDANSSRRKGAHFLRQIEPESIEIGFLDLENANESYARIPPKVSETKSKVRQQQKEVVAEFVGDYELVHNELRSIHKKLEDSYLTVHNNHLAGASLLSHFSPELISIIFDDIEFKRAQVAKEMSKIEAMEELKESVFTRSLFEKPNPTIKKLREVGLAEFILNSLPINNEAIVSTIEGNEGESHQLVKGGQEASPKIVGIQEGEMEGGDFKEKREGKKRNKKEKVKGKEEGIKEEDLQKGERKTMELKKRILEEGQAMEAYFKETICFYNFLLVITRKIKAFSKNSLGSIFKKSFYEKTSKFIEKARKQLREFSGKFLLKNGKLIRIQILEEIDKLAENKEMARLLLEYSEVFSEKHYIQLIGFLGLSVEDTIDTTTGKFEIDHEQSGLVPNIASSPSKGFFFALTFGECRRRHFFDNYEQVIRLAWQAKRENKFMIKYNNILIEWNKKTMDIIHCPVRTAFLESIHVIANEDFSGKLQADITLHQEMVLEKLAEHTAVIESFTNDEEASKTYGEDLLTLFKQLCGFSQWFQAFEAASQWLARTELLLAQRIEGVNYKEINWEPFLKFIKGYFKMLSMISSPHLYSSCVFHYFIKEGWFQLESISRLIPQIEEAFQPIRSSFLSSLRKQTARLVLASDNQIIDILFRLRLQLLTSTLQKGSKLKELFRSDEGTRSSLSLLSVIFSGVYLQIFSEEETKAFGSFANNFPAGFPSAAPQYLRERLFAVSVVDDLGKKHLFTQPVEINERNLLDFFGIIRNSLQKIQEKEIKEQVESIREGDLNQMTNASLSAFLVALKVVCDSGTKKTAKELLKKITGIRRKLRKRKGKTFGSREYSEVYFEAATVFLSRASFRKPSTVEKEMQNETVEASSKKRIPDKFGEFLVKETKEGKLVSFFEDGESQKNVEFGFEFWSSKHFLTFWRFPLVSNPSLLEVTEESEPAIGEMAFWCGAPFVVIDASSFEEKIGEEMANRVNLIGNESGIALLFSSGSEEFKKEFLKFLKWDFNSSVLMTEQKEKKEMRKWFNIAFSTKREPKVAESLIGFQTSPNQFEPKIKKASFTLPDFHEEAIPLLASICLDEPLSSPFMFLLECLKTWSKLESSPMGLLKTAISKFKSLPLPKEKPENPKFIQLCDVFEYSRATLSQTINHPPDSFERAHINEKTSEKERSESLLVNQKDNRSCMPASWERFAYATFQAISLCLLGHSCFFEEEMDQIQEKVIETSLKHLGTSGKELQNWSFYESNSIKSRKDSLLKMIRKITDKKKLNFLQKQAELVIQFYSALQSSSTTVISGLPFSGKSTIIELVLALIEEQLLSASSACRSQTEYDLNQPVFHPCIHMAVIHPEALYMEPTKGPREVEMLMRRLSFEASKQLPCENTRNILALVLNVNKPNPDCLGDFYGLKRLQRACPGDYSLRNSFDPYSILGTGDSWFSSSRGDLIVTQGLQTIHTWAILETTSLANADPSFAASNSLVSVQEGLDLSEYVSIFSNEFAKGFMSDLPSLNQNILLKCFQENFEKRTEKLFDFLAFPSKETNRSRSMVMMTFLKMWVSSLNAVRKEIKRHLDDLLYEEEEESPKASPKESSSSSQSSSRTLEESSAAASLLETYRKEKKEETSIQQFSSSIEDRKRNSEEKMEERSILSKSKKKVEMASFEDKGNEVSIEDKGHGLSNEGSLGQNEKGRSFLNQKSRVGVSNGEKTRNIQLKGKQTHSQNEMTFRSLGSARPNNRDSLLEHYAVFLGVLAFYHSFYLNISAPDRKALADFFESGLLKEFESNSFVSAWLIPFMAQKKDLIQATIEPLSGQNDYAFALKLAAFDGVGEPFCIDRNDLFVPTPETIFLVRSVNKFVGEGDSVTLYGPPCNGKSKFFKFFLENKGLSGSLLIIEAPPNWGKGIQTACFSCFKESLQKNSSVSYKLPNQKKRLYLVIDDIKMEENQAKMKQNGLEMVRAMRNLQGWFDNNLEFVSLRDPVNVMLGITITEHNTRAGRSIKDEGIAKEMDQALLFDSVKILYSGYENEQLQRNLVLFFAIFEESPLSLNRYPNLLVEAIESIVSVEEDENKLYEMILKGKSSVSEINSRLMNQERNPKELLSDNLNKKMLQKKLAEISWEKSQSFSSQRKRQIIHRLVLNAVRYLRSSDYLNIELKVPQERLLEIIRFSSLKSLPLGSSSSPLPFVDLPLSNILRKQYESVDDVIWPDSMDFFEALRKKYEFFRKIDSNEEAHIYIRVFEWVKIDNDDVLRVPLSQFKEEFLVWLKEEHHFVVVEIHQKFKEFRAIVKNKEEPTSSEKCLQVLRKELREFLVKNLYLKREVWVVREELLPEYARPICLELCESIKSCQKSPFFFSNSQLDALKGYYIQNCTDQNEQSKLGFLQEPESKRALQSKFFVSVLKNLSIMFLSS